MKYDIALCTDENFVIPALVCLTSIFENNKDLQCRVILLTDGITLQSREKFIRLAALYNCEIIIKKIDQTHFCDLKVIDRYPKSMYYRFLLPRLLQDSLTVLYLDCDVIVRHSLRSLFGIDISESACAVVLDQQCDDVQIQNRLKLTSPYFNSGVLLFNLAYWREHNITEELISFIKDYPNLCQYPDQDALNVVLSGKVKYISCTYNCQELWLTSRYQIRFHYSRWAEIDEISKNPTIVHFCVGDKPWYVECKNPFKDDYLYYAQLHAFIGFHLRKKYRKLYYLMVAWEMRFYRWSRKFIN